MTRVFGWVRQTAAAVADQVTLRLDRDVVAVLTQQAFRWAVWAAGPALRRFAVWIDGNSPPPTFRRPPPLQLP